MKIELSHGGKFGKNKKDKTDKIMYILGFYVIFYIE